jgi:putative salt-induced outer membrane protein YdiY
LALDGKVFHDRLADLSYRANGSLSIGRHFIRTDRTAFSAEAGPGYVAEKKGGEEEGFVAGRLAQYFEFMVTPSLQVWQSLEYMPNLEDPRVYFLNAEIGLETRLLSDLSLRFTVEDRYDSHPAEDKENNELLTTTALSWSF